MKNFIKQLEENCLGFKLGEEQRQVLLSIFCLLDKRFNGFCEIGLTGKPGTGKSTIVSLIIRYLQHNNIIYKLVAPTHKAKYVLSQITKDNVTTIHNLLKLKPNLNILELDLFDLQFVSTMDNDIPQNGVLIIDECSMINDDLYNTIVKECENKKCKILWVGDEAQIKAVNQKSTSKTFKINHIFELSKVYRQKDNNPLLELLDNVRKRPIYEFSEFESPYGSLKVYKHWKPFLEENINLFKESIKEGNPNKVKLFAYTNKQVEAFNVAIRNRIFDSPKEYELGEILTAYDTVKCNYQGYETDLVNSYDYIIKYCEKGVVKIGNIDCIVWFLSLLDSNDNDYVNTLVLSKENDSEIFNKISDLIESVRLSAVTETNTKLKSKKWVKYYKLLESFLTPVDLFVNNKLVRKKSIDYGYALTAHKSQSCSIDNVLIDFNNICKCKDKVELRQMEYVTLSRTKNNTYILL